MQVLAILDKFAGYYGISNFLGLIAIILLISRGAANENTPLTFELIIQDKMGTKTTVYKKDLLDAYYTETGNKYLRRLAETIYEDIAIYLEKFNLECD